MRTEKEILEERLKWLKEAQRMSEGKMMHHQNPYLECFKDDFLPSEFRRLADMGTEELEKHIERVERDLRDVERGEFKIE